MNPVVRSVLAVIAGMLVAFTLIAVVQVIGMRVYPPPPGLDRTNIESIKTAMAQVPLGALLFVLLSYTVGSVVGGWLTARIAPNGGMKHAMVVAALLFGAGLITCSRSRPPRGSGWLRAPSTGSAPGAGPRRLPARPVPMHDARTRAVFPAAVLALVMFAAATSWAHEPGAIPDSAQMAALRKAAARAPVLLVRGDFGLREYHRAELDSSGVGPRVTESARRPRPAVFATADAPGPALSRPTPWSEISTLETQQPRKLRGAVAGFVLGLAVGAALAGTRDDQYTGDLSRAALVIGTPMGGALLGLLVGSTSGSTVIYRAPIAEVH